SGFSRLFLPKGISDDLVPRGTIDGVTGSGTEPAKATPVEAAPVAEPLQLHGPYHHQITKGGLPEILETRQLRIQDTGTDFGPEIRANLGEAHSSSGGGVIVFYTHRAPYVQPNLNPNWGSGSQVIQKVKWSGESV